MSANAQSKPDVMGRSKQRQTFFTHLVQAQIYSGLTIKEFCESYRLDLDEFRRCRTRLEKSKVAKQAKGSAFLPITLKASPANTIEKSKTESIFTPLEVNMSRGQCCLKIPMAFEESALKKVIKIIGDYHAELT